MHRRRAQPGDRGGQQQPGRDVQRVAVQRGAQHGRAAAAGRQVHRGHRVGQAGHRGQHHPAGDDLRHPEVCAERGGRAFHQHAGRYHDQQRRRGDQHVPAAAERRVDDLLEFLLLLGDGHGQPVFPAPGDRQAVEPSPARAEQHQVGQQHREHRGQPGAGRDAAGRGDQADQRYPQPDRPAQQDHFAVQRDPARHQCAQAEQCGQVEHVGADDDARADLLLVLGQRADRRGDLRCVGGQRGHHTEQRLGQAQPFPDPLQPGDQQIAGGQAGDRAEAERDDLDGDRHWAAFLPDASRMPTSLPGAPAASLSVLGHQGLGVELP